jgi:hypothetical protein
VHRDARARAKDGYEVFNEWFTDLSPRDQAKVREIEPELQRAFDDYDARILSHEE